MLYAIVAVAILICDQAVKLWTNLNIVHNGPAVNFIPGIIRLENVHNSGAAWGLGSGSPFFRWLFIVLTIIVCIALVVLLARNIIKDKLGRWMVVFIIAGGIGNVIDRIMNGYVVDMFRFDFWNTFPVFNVADIFVTVGGIVFCLYLIFQKEDEEEKESTPKRTRTRTTPMQPQRERVDYLSQLQKPVVEGREAIRLEAERKAKEAELLATKKQTGPAPLKQPSREFAEWNMPFEKLKSEKKENAGEATLPETPKTAMDKALEEFDKKTSPISTPTLSTTSAPKKSVLDTASTQKAESAHSKDQFTLESILSEFTD